MKKIIFYSITVILLVFSLILSLSKVDIVENKKDSTKVETINEVSEVLKSLKYLLSNKKEEDQLQFNNTSDEEINFKNMTFTNISEVKSSSSIERYKYSIYEKFNQQKEIVAYFTEEDTYCTSKFYLVSDIKEYTTSDTRDDFGELRLIDVQKDYQSIDIDVEFYLTAEKVFIKFNKFIIINYSRLNEKKPNINIYNLFSTFNSGVYKGKWIDFTNCSNLSDIILEINKFNEPFFSTVSENIIEYNNLGDNFIQNNDTYRLSKDKFKELLKKTEVKEFVDFLLVKDSFEGDLVLDLSKRNIDINLLLNCKYNNSVDGVDRSVDCYELDNIAVSNINTTNINNIENFVIYDYKEVEHLFENFVIGGEENE